MTDVEALDAVVARLVGKEIVGAKLGWLGEMPAELRLKFYGGGELHINGFSWRGGESGVSLDERPPHPVAHTD